jgi:4-hydroxybenzoate polyprenyltransferase
VSLPEPVQVVELRPRRRPAVAALAACRPRQWPKNLLLFAGILFAAQLGDVSRWADAVAAFVAYCAASSAAYLVNDLRDLEQDRVHPTKRLRPLARGELSVRAALVLSACLAALALGIGAALGPVSLGLVALFLGLQAAYSVRLKHVVLVDVMAIGALFVIRAAAGAAAVHVRISPWLLLCTALLALFLGLAKRRGELILVGAARTPGRPVLEGYSLALVDQLVAVVASCTVLAYCLYTFTATESKAMMLTIPFVLFGVFRYLLLIYRDDLGEEPEQVLLTDRPILVDVALWALAAALILLLT